MVYSMDLTSNGKVLITVDVFNTVQQRIGLGAQFRNGLTVMWRFTPGSIRRDWHSRVRVVYFSNYFLSQNYSNLTSPILKILIKRMKMKGIQLCYFLGQYLIYFTIILHKVNGLEIWWWLAVSLGRLVLVSITCPFALLSVSHNLGTWIRKVLANRLNRGYNLRYWIYVTCTCWPLSTIG
jgi:hypothetical protein